jgi:hypothetical protein
MFKLYTKSFILIVTDIVTPRLCDGLILPSSLILEKVRN